MIKNSLVILFLQLLSFDITGQIDSVPPVPPVLEKVSIDYRSGFTELKWISSPSADAAGYVIYSYRNNEGYPIDTVHDPFATNYIYRKSASSFFSETFVVAAIDTSVNTSPLSNALRTIFVTAVTDTCHKQIRINWNSYLSEPMDVKGYTILASLNGGSFQAAGTAPDSVLSYSISDFTDDAQYCFVVNANLEDGSVSGSNKTCLTTRIRKPPQWINADFASIDGDQVISLSFSYDKTSEINTFMLEKKSGDEAGFHEIARLTSDDGSVKYSDYGADKGVVNLYRLSAINSCNIPVVNSNISSSIVLTLGTTDRALELRWTPYRNWLGSISSYKIFVDTGSGFREKADLSSSDTSLLVDFKEISYDITGSDICFYLEATEKSNPFGITGVSRSEVKCTEIDEKITVPNVFTPDNDLKNDFFRPVISFTPASYHLVITGLKGNILFETNDFLDQWDGKRNGKPVSQGVYLWFLRITTPAGKSIAKTGTVTIVSH